uniref:Uncharacterized protein n=1 Tax=Anguilla anguilla TaxID=7936 RepID=A0A0E9UJT2_ANGAN
MKRVIFYTLVSPCRNVSYFLSAP